MSATTTTTTSTTTTTTAATHFLNVDISPDPDLLQTILALQDKLCHRLSTPPPHTATRTSSSQLPPPTCVPLQNLHLTVCCLGLDDASQESEVLRLLQDLREEGQLRKISQQDPGRQVTVRFRYLEVFLPLDPDSGSRGPCAVVMSVDQTESRILMRVIQHLRQALSGFLRERARNSGLPYNPHVTLVSNCYHDDPESLLDEGDRARDLGACTVNRIYLSKLGDTTEEGIFKHHATLLLNE